MRRGQFRDENLLLTQQFQHAQRQTQATEERSQRSRERQAWDRVDELNEECEELGEEVRSLRDQLARSKALNRLTMIQNRGLVETIRHLRKSWTPENPQELAYKEKISPLIELKIGQVESDAEVVRQIESELDQKTAPVPQTR